MKIRLHRFVSYLILYTIYLIPSFSQDVKFTRIGSEQGLSQASVNCILQDKKGYLWFGTQDGLNKYDGYGMVVYKHDASDTNSLSDNWIEYLYEDSKGIIWVGTHDGGLNAYNPMLKKFTHYQTELNNPNSISNEIKKCIHEDKNGTYWIGTNYGLNSFDGKTNKFEKYFHEEGDTTLLSGFRVETIYEDKKGRLWIGTHDGGLNLFNPAQKTFHCYLDESIGKESQYYNRIKTITEDESGILWITTDNGGLASFNPETKKYLQRFTYDGNPNSKGILDNRISSVCFDDKKVLWIATKSEGIFCYRKNENIFSHFRNNDYDFQSLSNDVVNCIYMDKQNNIWIGTEAGGINVYFPNAARFKHYHKDITNENEFQSNTIFSITEDREGLIWAGTLQGGITTINRATNTYKNFGNGTPTSLSRAKNNSVLSLFEDKDGLIWVGTWGGGINTYDKKTGKINCIMESDAVTCIAQGNGHLIWIGVYGRGKGLFAYNKETQSMTNFTADDGLSSNDINCIYEDKNRNIWIGTAGGGLNKLNLSNSKEKKCSVKIYKYEKGRNSLSNNTVNCIYDDEKGNLWIGTSNGFDKFDIKKETFTHFYEKDGLPNSNIWGILGDKKGNFWISTNKGIARFNPNIENKEGNAFKSFTTRDGLQGDEFNQGSYFQNKKTDEMFFGGLNGFNSFYPDDIADNNHIPPVYITSFKKFGKETELDTSISDKKNLELSYKDNFISFDFVSLDYTFSAKNKYSFMMEGLDNDWSPPSPRKYVSYTNLPGGDYTFRIRASNSDGVWNEKGVELHIKVIPPWWKTNIFYIFCVLFTVAFVFGFIRYRTSAIQKEKKILEQKVAERTAELAQKNKDITSSIQYAKRIQQAILPTREQIQKHFPESFVLFKPKDIVSGDFYWFGEKNGRKIAACVDCTGHGVPGAFMSMIGTNLLNQIILEDGITDAAAILSALNQGVRSALKQGVRNEIETTDGMDIALCSIDSNAREVQFSSALRHLIVISENKITKIVGNKFPIGGAQLDTERIFTNHLINPNKGDMIYMFSDGFADQFGGDKGKKFMIKQLHELLLSVNNLPLKEQSALLEKTLEDWKGNHSQVDDVLVIGIRV